jgi:hypothetical protein
MGKIGKFDGYTQYRYGDKKKVPLPHVEILKGRRRETAINKVMDILGDWRFSPFEFEGVVRTGLREAFCLSGNEWPAADAEAASLVEESFKRSRAVRPKWIQSQRDYATSQGYCFFCNAQLEGGFKSQRKFCSTECANMTLDKWSSAQGKCDDPAYLAAFYAVNSARYWQKARGKSKPRKCEQCGGQFRVVRDTLESRFCSRPCYHASMRTLYQISCKACGTQFMPYSASSLYCSRSCDREARKDVRHLRQCEFCKLSFMGKTSKTMFCGTKCMGLMRGRRKKAKATIIPFPTISPAVFDQEFARAA